MVELARTSRSRREIQPPSVETNPAQFGAGVSKALSGFSNALNAAGDAALNEQMSEARLGKAQVARERGVEISDAKSRWIQLQSDFARETDELFRATDDAMLKGWTNSVEERAQTRVDEFLATLTPEVAREFGPDATMFTTQQAMSAYTMQREAEDNELLRRTNVLVATSTDALTNLEDGIDPEITMQNAMEKVEFMISELPFPEVQKAELLRGAEENLNRALLYRQAYEQAQNRYAERGQVPGRITRKNGLDIAQHPVATGLSKTAAGFLNFVAGPESGGAYNRQYAGQGVRSFDDYSKHPNSGAPITQGAHKGQVSTAAGRYQFINGTWQRVAAAIGATDFGPEWQDRGAWYLAQADYQQRTGRDLEYDLRTGDDARLQSIIDTLGGGDGKPVTWEGIQGKTPAQLRAFLNGATGTPSNLENDPRFASIPRNERVQIMQSGQQKALTALAQQMEELEVEQARFVNSIKDGIRAGDNRYTEGSIRNLSTTMKLGGEQEEELIKFYREQNALQYAAAEGLEKILSGNLGTTEQTNKALTNIWEAGNYAESFAARDEEWAEQYAMLIQRAGTMPQGQESQFQRALNSPDIQQAVFAADLLQKIQLNTPEALAGFSDDMRKNIALFSTLRELGIPGEKIVADMQAGLNPGAASMVEANRKRFQEEIKDNLDFFTPAGLINLVDLPTGWGADVELAQAPMLEQDARSLMEYFFTHTGDWSSARDATRKVLQETWGVAEVNGLSQIMKHPPSKVLPAYKGSHEWVTEQIREEYGDQTMYLITDTNTKTALRDRQAVSWRVAKPAPNGIGTVYMTFRDTPEWSRFAMESKARGMSEEMLRIIGDEHVRYTAKFDRAELNRQSFLSEEERLAKKAAQPQRGGNRTEKGFSLLDPIVDFYTNNIEPADAAVQYNAGGNILDRTFPGVAKELYVLKKENNYDEQIKYMTDLMAKIEALPEPSGGGQGSRGDGLTTARKQRLMHAWSIIVKAMDYWNTNVEVELEEEFPVGTE